MYTLKLSSSFIPIFIGITGYGIGTMIGSIFGIYGLYIGFKKGLKTEYKILKVIMNTNSI